MEGERERKVELGEEIYERSVGVKFLPPPPLHARVARKSGGPV